MWNTRYRDISDIRQDTALQYVVRNRDISGVTVYKLKRYVVQCIQYRDISCFREEKKRYFRYGKIVQRKW